jgi:hypothetical protein
MECCFKQEPLVILEHDCFLKKPDNLWYHDNYGIIFYDDAAMGSYVIQPWFAKMLVKFCMDITISSGPYSIIHILGFKTNMLHKIVNKSHRKFKPASCQVMSKRYGNTIEHYSNLHPEHWPDDSFYKFTEID